MEGPSLLIASEELQTFVGKRILKVEGNTKLDKERLLDKDLRDVFSWGKHLVFQFDTFAFRVHFLMFGSYRATIEGVQREGDYQKPKDMIPRLALIFINGEIKIYNCSIKFIESENARDTYDTSVDIMSSGWNSKQALEEVLRHPQEKLIDILLDQYIFAGVGNIIKNEVLHRQRIHPDTLVSDLSNQRLAKLIEDTREYSHLFYEWRKKYELKQHWEVYRQKLCKVCGSKVIKQKLGKRQRMTHYCLTCQPPGK